MPHWTLGEVESAAQHISVSSVPFEIDDRDEPPSVVDTDWSLMMGPIMNTAGSIRRAVWQAPSRTLTRTTNVSAMLRMAERYHIQSRCVTGRNALR